MSKINFKVGDTIRRRKDSSFGPFRCDPGPFKIVALDRRDGYTEVTLDRVPNKAILQTTSGWDIDFFEKVPAEIESGEFILILRDSKGNLAPSTKPRTYITEAQAKAVAAEMAEKYPGCEFVIFKAVGKAKTVAATVEMY